MQLDPKLTFLRQRLLETAFVKDAEKGYLVVEPFNLVIDPDILQFASRAWAHHYRGHQIDSIVGLPDAGARLVSILADMLLIDRILPSKRTDIVPGSWTDVISYSNQSFTMDHVEKLSHIGFVRPGDKVLIVDDVIAHGTTAVAAIKALQESEVEVVGMCVLFDKVWQGGLELIQAETGVEPCSLIRIEQIDEDGKLVLMD